MIEMSTKKRQKTEHKIVTKDEENDCFRQSLNRLNDKLIQILLNYLPLKDKILLFAVNKRMKKCLAESQTDLIFDSKIGNQFNSCSEMESVVNRMAKDVEEDHSDEELDFYVRIKKPALNWLLKTFTRLETIDLRNCSLDSQMIDLICDNDCPELKFLKITDFGIEENLVVRLGQTYGQRLAKLRIQSSFTGHKSGFDKLFLKYCQNLTHFYCESIESFNDKSKDFLPKLQNVFTILTKAQDRESVQIIVDKYKEQLKSFSGFIHLEDGNDIKTNMDLISGFKNLESLNLDFFEPQINSKAIDESFRRIAINCQQLNWIRICFNYCGEDMITTDLLNAFGYFRNTKTLCTQFLVTANEDSNQKNIQDMKNANIACLKDCKQLTRLEFAFSLMTDRFLEDIHLYSPNLISLHLSSGEQLSDAGLGSMSRLKCLKVLKLSKNRFKSETFPQITDSGITELLTSCPTIRSVIFLGRPNITQKSIEVFIVLAEKYPNRGYRFECLFKDTDITDEQKLDQIDVNCLKIPLNLSVRVERSIEELSTSFEDLFDSEDDSDVSIDEDLDSYESENGSGDPIDDDLYESENEMLNEI